MDDVKIRALWLAVALVFGFACGVAAAVIAHVNGTALHKSLLAGGAAFAGATAFALSSLQFLFNS